MSDSIFELAWFGGPAERRFRRLRSDVDDLDWSALDPAKYSPEALARARLFWTQSAVSELRAAARFAHVLKALVEAGAPLDLVGMASDFVTDELVHAELAARLAMRLGGAAPVLADVTTFGGGIGDDATSALVRATSAVVSLSCVQEGFNQALLAEELKRELNPLVRAEMELVARDEARHAAFGWHVLEWADELLDDDQHAEVTRAAALGLGRLPLTGEQPASVSADDIALGMVGVADFLPELRAQVDARVVKRLGEMGVDLAMP